MSAKHASPGPQLSSANPAGHPVLQLLMIDVARSDDPFNKEATGAIGDDPGNAAMMQLQIPSAAMIMMKQSVGLCIVNSPSGYRYPLSHRGCVPPPETQS
jgi:hypothetical protein